MQTELEITPHTVIPIMKDDLARREVYRTFTTRARETVHFPYLKLSVREGHNGRTEDNPGFSRESLEELARSMISQGQLEPITVDAFIDGTGIITKGERRWRAQGIIREWIASGKISELFQDDPKKNIPSFDTMECFINPLSYSEKERTIGMLLENSGTPLTPLEHAEVIARLKKDGMTAAQIAKAIPGLNTMQVSLRLTLASASDEEKDAIREGKISPTAAVKLIKEEEDPAKRMEMINEAAAGEDGKLQIKEIGADTEEDKPDEYVNGESGEVFLTQEELDNSLRNADLKSASESEPIDPADDKSLKGTSPRASTPTGDPAQKAKDDIDASDDRITSGKATAYDLVLKALELNKQFDLATEVNQSPAVTTLIFELDRVLYDLKAILKK